MSEENEENSLSIEDMGLMVQVIDLCSKRGAFRGAELEVVGQLRSKFQNFLIQNAPGQSTEKDDFDE